MKTVAGFSVAVLVALNGCFMPNTYFDPFDNYVRGLRFYDHGHYELARQCWAPMAESGDPDAQYRYGLLLYTGKAVPQDGDKAVYWWRRAAAQNQPKAQIALGDVHYQNDAQTLHHGVESRVRKDLVEAYMWYRLSEKSTVYEGEAAYLRGILPQVKMEMTPDQIEQGEQRAAKWRPDPGAKKPRNLW